MAKSLIRILVACAAFSVSQAQQPLPLSANAGDPIFDIPKIDGVTIDGKGDDWNQAGFRIETLAGEAGVVREPKDFDPSFQLGWDERGLLVLVTVRCNKFTEADEPNKLWQKNGVEMFLGDRVGSPEYFQVLAGTGADARFPKLRTFIKDLRKTVAPQKLEIEAASTRIADGYVLELRLPWSNLAIKPQVGREAAFQLYVNNATEEGSKVTVSWYPWQDAYLNPNAMARLRLAEKASPAAMIAARASQNLGRSCVEVVAPITFSGKQVDAKMHGKTFATSTFESASGRARAVFLLPPGDVEISSADGGNVQIPGIAEKFNAAATRAINHAYITFKPCVFSEEQFPPCEFTPSGVIEKALGKCVLTLKFYDAEYHEVKTANKPGRYGAIVQVKAENGQTFKYFSTLYRLPKKLHWRLGHIRFSSLEFPPEIGLNPEVVKERSKEIGDYFARQMANGICEGQDAAIMFAGLEEQKTGGEPPRDRNGCYALNQKWWYGLKKQTGDLRADEYVYLPESYENDSRKNWPLILFLHGAGERGYDIARIKPFLANILKGKSDFPCIVVAPQCPLGEWWSPFELNDLLDRVQAKYRVDTDRVYLTGLSMGGFGSWALAAQSPKRFAAVVPICGGGDPEDADRIKDIPIWVFHGAKDETVPIQKSQEMVDALKEIGGNVKFTNFPEVDHNSWTPAYAMPELYDWLLQQRRAMDRR